MTMSREVSLQAFDFWGGSADFARQLSAQELDTKMIMIHIQMIIPKQK